uniref:Uncharacterized protein n=1 Tax=Physcomitrium patens TaxID=3218 RepID=A0A2K1IZC7_PHYPA|nr:hypothetical protein PHYPA_024450 [Physcomitrium patens]
MVDDFSQSSLVSFAFDTTVPSSFIKPDFSHMTSYIFLRIPSSSPTNCRGTTSTCASNIEMHIIKRTIRRRQDPV